MSYHTRRLACAVARWTALAHLHVSQMGGSGRVLPSPTPERLVVSRRGYRPSPSVPDGARQPLLLGTKAATVSWDGWPHPMQKRVTGRVGVDLVAFLLPRSGAAWRNRTSSAVACSCA